jgi:glycosyltransferase involved in cell wall biosynthesis
MGAGRLPVSDAGRRVPAQRLDIVIPTYEEGESIVQVIRLLAEGVKSPKRILICYDHDTDSTLTALNAVGDLGVPIEYVKNQGVGAHGAVLTGFRTSDAEAVLVFPADDVTNAGILDRMYAQIRAGCDIACASRFMKGGAMINCPPLKDFLVRGAAWSLYLVARLPTHDATNGFRMFSRRVLDEIPIESTQGFTYSIELLVKVHRRGWRVGEVPAVWIERKVGTSRFRVLKWLPAYLRWYGYAFATTYLRRRA